MERPSGCSCCLPCAALRCITHSHLCAASPSNPCRLPSPAPRHAPCQLHRRRRAAAGLRPRRCSSTASRKLTTGSHRLIVKPMPKKQCYGMVQLATGHRHHRWVPPVSGIASRRAQPACNAAQPAKWQCGERAGALSSGSSVQQNNDLPTSYDYTA